MTSRSCGSHERSGHDCQGVREALDDRQAAHSGISAVALVGLVAVDRARGHLWTKFAEARLQLPPTRNVGGLKRRAKTCAFLVVA
jgi:hypothetical protein